MNFNHLLNQVLNVAKNEVTKTMGSNSTASTIAKAGGASAAIGLLSMVLGRKGGANLTKLGSLAALGSLAYQAYQTYQQNQAQSAGQIQESRFAQSAEEQSQLLLQVMIAAAIADGEISDEEKQVIQREVGNDLALSQWIEQAINRPISIDEIAAQVGGGFCISCSSLSCCSYGLCGFGSQGNYLFSQLSRCLKFR